MAAIGSGGAWRTCTLHLRPLVRCSTQLYRAAADILKKLLRSTGYMCDEKIVAPQLLTSENLNLRTPALQILDRVETARSMQRRWTGYMLLAALQRYWRAVECHGFRVPANAQLHLCRI